MGCRIRRRHNDLDSDQPNDRRVVGLVDASWLKAEFAASSDDPNGTGVLSPGESLSIPLLVNRDDLRSGAYSGSVFFDYSENTGISGSLEINEEMSAFNMLCSSDLNDNGQIDFSEAVKLAIQYLLVKPNPALGRVPSLTETLKVVMAHLDNLQFKCDGTLDQ